MANNTFPFWQRAAWVAACVQVVVVGFNLIFISSQLRQHRLQLTQQTQQLNQQVELSRAANTQALANLIIPLNVRVTEPGKAQLWIKGEDGINKVSDTTERAVQTQQYRKLVASYMVFYENVYSQCLAGLLDEEIYNGWDHHLADFSEEHRKDRHWDQWKHLYHKGFSNRVSQIIATPRSMLPRQHARIGVCSSHYESATQFLLISEVERRRAVNRGLEFLYKTACEPENFEMYGYDYLFCFRCIESTSKDSSLRNAARKMGHVRARQWRREHPRVPANAETDDIRICLWQ